MKIPYHNNYDSLSIYIFVCNCDKFDIEKIYRYTKVKYLDSLRILSVILPNF